MTLVISKGITLAKANNGIVDPDAIIYINNVEKADGENLEYDTAKAMHDFVVGCKTDGIWNAIKASCILAGARTLTGALVPLVGAAPTNVDGLFVSDDYDRKTGLVGDGSTKYLDSNRNNNADPQDSQHFFCRVSATPAGTAGVIGAGGTDSGSSNIVFVSGAASYRSRSNITGFSTTTHGLGGFGASRSSSASFSYLSSSGVTDTAATTSQTPFNGSIHVFQRNTSTTLISNARLSFYSIGESLDLALLNARVTDLINAFAAAIP
jgi:hypothetical protein